MFIPWISADLNLGCESWVRMGQIGLLIRFLHMPRFAFRLSTALVRSTLQCILRPLDMAEDIQISRGPLRRNFGTCHPRDSCSIPLRPWLGRAPGADVAPEKLEFPTEIGEIGASSTPDTCSEGSLTSVVFAAFAW